MIICILAAGGLASAQTGNSSTEAPGVRILKVGLQAAQPKGPTARAIPGTDPTSLRQQNADRLRSPDNNPALHRMSKDAEVAPVSGSSPFGNLASGPHVIFVAAIVVKNTSTKTVKAVHWRYLLFKTGEKEPVKKYQIKSKIVIRPGEQVELTKEVDPKGNEHQAMITAVEYEDGSVWRSAPK